MPSLNPEAVRQRAIEAARQRSGRLATLSLDPLFVALNRGKLPIRARSDGELAERMRRAEHYAALGARMVVGSTWLSWPTLERLQRRACGRRSRCPARILDV
jgi:hypothetical protein